MLLFLKQRSKGPGTAAPRRKTHPQKPSLVLMLPWPPQAKGPGLAATQRKRPLQLVAAVKVVLLLL